MTTAGSWDPFARARQDRAARYGPGDTSDEPEDEPTPADGTPLSMSDLMRADLDRRRQRRR